MPFITDSGRIHQAEICTTVKPSSVEELRALVLRAQRDGVKISLRGVGKSQGGLTFADRALVVDLNRLNTIDQLDVEARTIRVQSGVTWDQIRSVIHPFGLAIRTTQSYGVFSVGGSISLNSHGRSIDWTSVNSGVESLRVMLATGEVKEASRSANKELFSAVCGGLGLMGIIVDVTLNLTDDFLYEKSELTILSSRDYVAHLQQKVLSDRAIQFHYGRLSCDFDLMWNQMFCVSYRLCEEQPSLGSPRPPLANGGDIYTYKFSIWSTERFNWAQRIKLPTEIFTKTKFEKLCRNNVGQENFRGLERGPRREIDLLQEFFIPIRNFTAFVEQAAAILRRERFLLYNTTVRYLKPQADCMLAYAREECLSLVIFYSQERAARDPSHTKKVLGQLMRCAVGQGGSFYLCYQQIADPELLNEAYPQLKDFLAVKQKFDPTALFTNLFYLKYGSVSESETVPQPISIQRPLRLPEPRRYAIHTADGMILPLLHYQGTGGNPVILGNGLAMTRQSMALDTIETNLLEYLHKKGYDLWYFDWRSCPELPSAKEAFSFDQAARWDWPAAVRRVQELSGSLKFHVVAYSMGAQTFQMSLAAGYIPCDNVISLTALQLGMHLNLAWLPYAKFFSRLPSLLRGVGLKSISYAAQASDALVYKGLDQLLKVYPVPDEEICDSPTCRRLHFMFGNHIRHANINSRTHERLGEIQGEISVGVYVQMSRMGRLGKVVSESGEDIYFENPERLALPITWIRGGRNKLINRQSTEATYEWLCDKNGKDYYRHHILENYGHLDALVGDNAVVDVYPLIADSLERAEKSSLGR